MHHRRMTDAEAATALQHALEYLLDAVEEFQGRADVRTSDGLLSLARLEAGKALAGGVLGEVLYGVDEPDHEEEHDDELLEPFEGN